MHFAYDPRPNNKVMAVSLNLVYLPETWNCLQVPIKVAKKLYAFYIL